MRDLVETVILADMRRRGVAPQSLIPTSQPRDPQLWRACQKFEALLLAQMFQAMQPKESAWFGKGLAGGVYALFFQEAVADAASADSPLGLARTLYAQLAEEASSQVSSAHADERSKEVPR